MQQIVGTVDRPSSETLALSCAGLLVGAWGGGGLLTHVNKIIQSAESTLLDAALP